MPRVEWNIQDGFESYGQEVELWTSSSGEWGFAYGPRRSGPLAIETLITGFETEEAAITAAHNHCYEVASDAAADMGDDL